MEKPRYIYLFFTSSLNRLGVEAILQTSLCPSPSNRDRLGSLTDLQACKTLRVPCTPSSLRTASWALPRILQTVKVKGAIAGQSSLDLCLCFSSPSERSTGHTEAGLRLLLPSPWPLAPWSGIGYGLSWRYSVGALVVDAQAEAEFQTSAGSGGLSFARLQGTLQ